MSKASQDRTVEFGRLPEAQPGEGVCPSPPVSRSDSTLGMPLGGGKDETEALPLQIGAYRIVSLIGHGGMGEVYEAEQKHPARRVALKVIRPLLVSRSLLRRFEFEAEVLGRLEHPGIARIYEAGTATSPAGMAQPFFAMELVRGRSILEYATAAALTPRQRLELVAQICDAVQYAHQKGVIHRDLKPANILVSEEGSPKILDFGVARVTDADVQTATMQTSTGQIVGTLQYMSPEQASGNSKEVDTRADVYALGAIAYELLIGRRPHDLTSKSLVEAVRLIREEEPSRLGTVDRSLRGDVETIIGKALEKDKERRYSGARSLAADIRRYLANEPIAARPPSASYQLAKFAKRNKVLVAGVAAVFVVLTAGIITTTTQAVRARAALVEVTREKAEVEKQKTQAIAEKDNAKAVLEFLTDEVLAGAAPERIRDVRVSDAIVRAMIAPAAAKVGQKFAGKPLLEASIRTAIADTLRAIGRSDLALPHAEWALRIRRRLLGDDHTDSITALNNYASILLLLGRSKEAEPLFKEALDRCQKTLGDDDPDSIKSLSNYASVLESLGRFKEAEPLFKEALDRYRKVLGSDHPYTINAVNSYATVLQYMGRAQEVEPLSKEALERFRKVLGDDNPDTINSLANYAFVLQSLGRAKEAEPMAKEALERRRQLLGENHPDTILSLNVYAKVLESLGRTKEAEPLYKETLDRRRKVLGEDHPETISSLNNYAVALKSLGRAKEAEPLLKEALDRYRNVLGVNHPDTIQALENYTIVLRSLGRAKEAELLYNEALECRQRLP